MKKQLKVLAEDWQGCQRCGLGKERAGPKIVFGIGKSTAKYLLIYDTPSESDASLGVAMTSREGDLLAALLEKAGIALPEVYATPLVGCRPTIFTEATTDRSARLADRD